LESEHKKLAKVQKFIAAESLAAQKAPAEIKAELVEDKCDYLATYREQIQMEMLQMQMQEIQQESRPAPDRPRNLMTMLLHLHAKVGDGSTPVLFLCALLFPPFALSGCQRKLILRNAALRR